MQFDSLTFLVFFALVLAGYRVLGSWPARKNFLLGASYLFYAAWNPVFLLLLLASTTLDWWIAQRVHQAVQPPIRKRWITATLLVNLGVLGYFKYAGFLLDNLSHALAAFGLDYRPPALDIILPIGISFYTFHSLSYCLDIYRGKFAPTRSWRDYALYVAFFPQLVAGPIVRWTEMRAQIETPRVATLGGLGLGLGLLLLGLFEKIVLADSVFAPVADAVFDQAAGANVATAWIGMIAFSGQIFCDFAGYSSCALGSALALGFVLPINFRNPYAAASFADFWRRWHISLSRWLRDYLYVSLGGNRLGRWLTLRNLMLTMLIGGLWHGAAWHFIVWGGLHGAFLALERWPRGQPWLARLGAWRLARAGYGLLTLLGVMLAWIWFRAHGVEDAWLLTGKLTEVDQWSGAWAASSFEQRLAVVVFGLLLLVHWRWRGSDARDLLARAPWWLLAPLFAVLLCLIVLSPGDNHAFLYFQF